jgi:hypothetical protein
VDDLREAGRSRHELKQRLSALASDVKVLEHESRMLDKVQRRLEHLSMLPAAPLAGDVPENDVPRPATA